MSAPVKTALPVKSFLLLAAMLLLPAGCATQDDLRFVSKSLDTKIAAVESNLSVMQQSLEEAAARSKEAEAAIGEIREANTAIRRSQADLNADIITIRDDLNRLRGAQEELQVQTDAVKQVRKTLDRIETRLEVIEARLALPDAEIKKPPKEVLSPRERRPRDSETLYSEAYGMFKEGDYAGSREGFREFLRHFPDTEYSDNAQFWIGESYYFEGKNEQAILEYQNVIERYPQGSRVPHSLLKQALAFDRLGESSNAILLLQRVVRDFPGTTPAEEARSKLLEIR